MGKSRRADARQDGRVSSRVRLLQISPRDAFAGSVSGRTCITASVNAAGDSACDGPVLAAIAAPNENA